MKKWFVIVFVTLFSLTATELHELCKLPTLVFHYLEHRSETPDLSLLDFLSVHYAHQTVYDDDYAKDQRLPFKNAETHLASFTLLLAMPQVAPAFVQSLSAVVLFIPKSIVPAYSAALRSSPYLAAIWQPPRH